MDTSPAARCQHIKSTGSRCGSPAIRSHRYCHYHRWPSHVANIVNDEENPVLLPVPIFEDAHAIQDVLSKVTFHILNGTLNSKTAGLVLYALQIASSNLKHIKQENLETTEVIVDVERKTGEPIVVPCSAVENQKDPVSKEHDPQDHGSGNQDLNNQEESAPSPPNLQASNPSDPTPNSSVRNAPKVKPECKLEDKLDDDLPPGTIQACERRPGYVN